MLSNHAVCKITICYLVSVTKQAQLSLDGDPTLKTGFIMTLPVLSYWLTYTVKPV